MANRGNAFVPAVLVLVLFSVIVAGVWWWHDNKDARVVDVPANVSNVSILVRAVDDFTGKPVSTSYSILMDDFVAYEGKTFLSGYDDARFNLYSRNFSNLNFMNSPGYGYYVTRGSYPLSFSNGRKAVPPVDVDMPLKPIGNLSVNVISNSDGLLRLNLSVSDGVFMDYGLCVKFTFGFFDVSPDMPYALGDGDVPSRFRSADKCYVAQQTLDSKNTASRMLNITYSREDELYGYDKIDFVFFDMDKDIRNDFIIESPDGKDVGAEDFMISIDYQGIVRKVDL